MEFSPPNNLVYVNFIWANLPLLAALCNNNIEQEKATAAIGLLVREIPVSSPESRKRVNDGELFAHYKMVVNE